MNWPATAWPLQEGRHALAEKVCHGRKGQLFQRYYQGMEDQLGALGIVLNCLVLWNTVYIDEALRALGAQGYQVRDEDVARLSPFIRKHFNVRGRIPFTGPNQASAGARWAIPRPPMTPTTRTNPGCAHTRPGSPRYGWSRHSRCDCTCHPFLVSHVRTTAGKSSPVAAAARSPASSGPSPHSWQTTVATC